MDEILKIYTGYDHETGHDSLFFFDNIKYVRADKEVDIAVSEHSLDARCIHDIVRKVNPKIIILHSSNHYWENGSWQHSLNDYKIVETYPNIFFLLLDHNVNTLGNEKETNNYKEIYYDYVYNYYRALMIGNPLLHYNFQGGFAALSSSWRPSTEEEIQISAREKIFLSLNKLYPDQGRTKYRKKLFEFLYENKNLGYLSGPGRVEHPGLVEKLIGWKPPTLHIPTEYQGKDGDIINIKDHHPRWFSPAHHHYYNTSYISVYAETIEYGSVIAPTEKSFVPLWKGHLIFPFSSRHYIKSLEKIEFMFPHNHINYDYDNIEDDDLRWETYLIELKRLINLPIREWENIYVNTKHIRLHNKNIFYSRSNYKIKPYLEKILNKKI